MKRLVDLRHATGHEDSLQFFGPVEDDAQFAAVRSAAPAEFVVVVEDWRGLAEHSLSA